MRLDEDERELYESVEKGGWTSVEDLIGEIATAREDGFSYQTLVSSIIHRYMSGRLKER